MDFSSNHFITVNNVLEKARVTYGKCSSLQLFNEHGRELNSQEVVENARVYTVKRRFVLFYIDTLSRMDVVPNRELNDFYRKQPRQPHSTCGIVDLNASSQPGSHWVCYYRNKSDRL